MEDGRFRIIWVEDLREHRIGRFLIESIGGTEAMQEAEHEVETKLEALLMGEQLADGVKNLLKRILTTVFLKFLNKSWNNLNDS